MVQNTEATNSGWPSTQLRECGVYILILVPMVYRPAGAGVGCFPRAIFQTCIVHMVRLTCFVPWKECLSICADLRR